jgi:WASH complex subunit strumpellin
MFDVLARLTALQSNTLEPLPIKIDLRELGRAAAPELRFRLPKMTHWWVATLAQGVLLISKTLLGVVEVDPRQVLETGVRSELATFSKRLKKHGTGHGHGFRQIEG